MSDPERMAFAHSAEDLAQSCQQNVTKDSFLCSKYNSFETSTLLGRLWSLIEAEER
jgi:hypothetical protein